MVEPLVRYKTYETTIKRLLLLAGLWPGDVPFKYYFLVMRYNIVQTLIFSFAIAYFVSNHITDMTVVTTNMAAYLSCVGSTVKCVMFMLNAKEFASMHETLDASFCKELDKPNIRKEMLSPITYFYYANKYLWRICVGVPVFLIINPIVRMTIMKARGSPVELLLPVPADFPWDPRGTMPVYGLHFLFEAWSCISLGFVSVSVDGAFGYYIFKTGGLFRSISYRIRNLGPNDDYPTIIRECMLLYEVVVKSRDTIERIYAPIVLYLMITNSISLCVNIYQISKMTSDNPALGIVYIMVKFVQTYVFAWYGMFLTTQSESYLEAVYNCEWAGSGEKRLMTDILIMLAGKPFVITAIFSTISMDMFVAILNTALSYFFLLKTLEESGDN